MCEDKCCFRFLKHENKIDIRFMYRSINGEGTIQKFIFSREPTEYLSSLIARIVKKVGTTKKKKGVKMGNCDTESTIEVLFYSNNICLPDNMTCFELFNVQGSVKLQIQKSVYEVVFNSPLVVNINLPHSILAGYPVYIEQFSSYYTIIHKSLFNWYKSLNNIKNGNDDDSYQFVGSGMSYTPGMSEIGARLKLECIPANNESKGPSFEIVSKNIVEANPGPCPFETRHMFTKLKLKQSSFRCMSYNILADLYCDSEYTRSVLYPYCPHYALHISYRKQLILKEIMGYNADIICLQEVDSKIFHNTLQPILTLEGYNGFYFKKGKEVTEGLSCFYRTDRFSLVENYKVLLSEVLKTEVYLQYIWNTIKDNTSLVNRISDRSTVASATVLKSTDNPNEIIIVGNTHLYFHPDADHIRLLQGGIIISWLKELRKELKIKMPQKRISIVLCGDFNSVPSCGIYKLYTTGIAPSTLEDWSSNTTEAVTNLTLTNDLLLESACGTPLYTNFTNGFADCLDYIFYEKAYMKVEQVVPFPSLEELKTHIALPSIVFPSDHIALVSDLRFNN